MQKWEYKQVVVDRGVLLESAEDGTLVRSEETIAVLCLNKLGNKGWELVTSTDVGWYWLKRPKP